jgi:hypothetical protein
MNCYVCVRNGKVEPAVAVCRNCFVGLCMVHLAEAQGHQVGGTKISCEHVLPKSTDLSTKVR